MECVHPYPPTPAHARLAAIHAHIQGEALCDAGKTSEGIAMLKRATFLAWELDAPDWPGWAVALYAQLQDGAPVPVPPPVLMAPVESDVAAASAGQCGASPAAQRYIPAALATMWRSRSVAQSSWWSSTEAFHAVSTALAAQNFVVLDDFAGLAACRGFRSGCETAWHSGELFHPAKVAEPGRGVDGKRSALTRSDYLAWVDVGTAKGVSGAEGDVQRAELGHIVSCVDTLARALRDRLLGPEAVITRQRPQVARYGLGDAFARHCDNYCPAGQPTGGPLCNGRWLTAVYYTSEDWQEADGGCLRIYRPQGSDVDLSLIHI